jgi:hypothetical protein
MPRLLGSRVEILLIHQTNANANFETLLAPTGVYNRLHFGRAASFRGYPLLGPSLERLTQSLCSAVLELFVCLLRVGWRFFGGVAKRVVRPDETVGWNPYTTLGIIHRVADH